MPILVTLFGSLGLSERVSRILGFAVPVALALALALVGFLWLRGSHYRDQRDTARAQVQAVEARLAVSNASIDRLQAVIAENNARIEADAKAYADAKKQASADQVKLAQQAKGSDATIAKLREIAAKPPPECVVPNELHDIARGL